MVVYLTDHSLLRLSVLHGYNGMKLCFNDITGAFGGFLWLNGFKISHSVLRESNGGREREKEREKEEERVRERGEATDRERRGERK